MQKFDDTSLLWFLAVIGLIASVFVLRAWRGYRRVAQDAESDYVYKSDQKMIDPRMTKDGYIRAYKRFYAPRSLAYAGAGFAAVLILTPLVVVIYSIVSVQLWTLAGQPLEYAPKTLVWQFFMFFATIAMWGSIAYFAAARFHKYAPRTLRDEMLREMN